MSHRSKAISLLTASRMIVWDSHHFDFMFSDVEIWGLLFAGDYLASSVRALLGPLLIKIWKPAFHSPFLLSYLT